MLKKKGKPGKILGFRRVYIFYLHQEKGLGMKNIIYYIWKNRLFPYTGLHTTSGEKLSVIDNGNNSDNSNVFHNAKIRIGDRTWVGNVVLHEKSSEWEREINNGKSQTGNIILHVIMENDCSTLRKHGEEIHQVCISYPKEFKSHIGKNCSCNMPCAQAVSQIETVKLHSILSRLLVERIEEKAKQIESIHERCDKRWEDALLKTLIKSFGFGIHTKLFEEFADTLNFQALGKHRDNSMQVEAMFFGQAGLLNELSIPYFYREFATKSNYFNELKKEYCFLEKKFNLRSMDYKAWESCGTQPHLRIARLAAIFHSNKFNMSNIAACNTIEELRETIATPLHGYWYNHTCFGGTETIGNSKMKERQTDVIIINAIAPILYVYGKHRKDYALCGKAEEYLHNLKCEENGIVRRWREQGIKVDCAADSQALLHLNKSYCSNNKCRQCQFAYVYIKSVLKCL